MEEGRTKRFVPSFPDSSLPNEPSSPTSSCFRDASSFHLSSSTGPSSTLQWSSREDLEKKMKRFQALLTKAQNGTLKLPDHGAKIAAKLRWLEHELRVLDESGDRDDEEADTATSAPRGATSAASTGPSGFSVLLSSSAHPSSVVEASRQQSATQQPRGVVGCEVQKPTLYISGDPESHVTAVPRTVASRSSQRRNEDSSTSSVSEASERSTSCSDSLVTSSSVDFRGVLRGRSSSRQGMRTAKQIREEVERSVMRREALVEVRRSSVTGRLYQIRNGVMEPLDNKLNKEAIAEAKERMRKELEKDLNDVAEKMQGMQMDDVPRNVGRRSRGLRQTDHTSTDEKREKPKGVIFISMVEAATSEKRSEDSRKEYEEKILARSIEFYKKLDSHEQEDALEDFDEKDDEDWDSDDDNA